ncbi:MAG: superoxide dismutase family protein [Sphingomonadales bacterium]
MKIWNGILGGAGMALLIVGAASAGQATVELKDQKGAPVGTITLTSGEAGMTLSGKFTGLPPGPHGFHIHEKGVCAGDFSSAGGHFNPGHAKHGILADAGRHAGDLPNLDVPESGSLNIDLFLNDVSLSPDAPGNLADADGSSFVIHAGPDDYKSDPSGNSGGRIACGVVEMSSVKAEIN